MFSSSDNLSSALASATLVRSILVSTDSVLLGCFRRFASLLVRLLTESSCCFFLHQPNSLNDFIHLLLNRSQFPQLMFAVARVLATSCFMTGCLACSMLSLQFGLLGLLLLSSTTKQCSDSVPEGIT